MVLVAESIGYMVLDQSLTKTCLHRMSLVLYCYELPLLSDSVSVGVCVSAFVVCVILVCPQNYDR